MAHDDAASQPFDFEKHAREAAAGYQPRIAIYQEFAEVLRDILRNAVAAAQIKPASIDSRAKSLQSFQTKAAQPLEVDPGRPKYADPLRSITDLAGVRVITFFPRDVEEIDPIIAEQFSVQERSDKSELLREHERLGYHSVHYLVKLKPNRVGLPEYRRFDGLVAEIQVRTVLQHAWAEIEHDIQYKSVETIPVAVRRRFMALAGMLEIADREFQAIQNEDRELRLAARESVQQGRLEQVEITGDALKAYLDAKLGSDGRMTAFSYDWTARLLLKLGFTNFRQIDEAIGLHNDDVLSRIVYGSRLGQLTRFETQLLAALGETFIARHPFSNQPWFLESANGRLEKLMRGGVTITGYDPSGTGDRP